MTPNWLRLAYAAELLLAIPAVYTLWSQVGGQGHLDLMAWYWKLLLGGAMCIAMVLATAAMVEGAPLTNRRVLGWIAVILLTGIAMAAITYYYHLHESDDETDEEDEPTSTSLIYQQPGDRS